jgi:hypothetical protein
LARSAWLAPPARPARLAPARHRSWRRRPRGQADADRQMVAVSASKARNIPTAAHLKGGRRSRLPQPPCGSSQGCTRALETTGPADAQTSAGPCPPAPGEDGVAGATLTHIKRKGGPRWRGLISARPWPRLLWGANRPRLAPLMPQAPQTFRASARCETLAQPPCARRGEAAKPDAQ